MMWVRLGLNFMVFCGILTFTNTTHEPPSGVPSFIRSSVEMIPEPLNDVSDKLKFSVNPTIGSIFLPLRSAVEQSAPIAPISFGKSFIRDSVEYRPASESGKTQSKPTHDEFRAEPQSDTNQITQLSGKYSAFYVPTAYDTKNPQPFRFGSPYQQIVDISSVNQISKEVLKKYEQEIELEQLSKLRLNSARDAEKSKYKVLCYITNWSFYRVPEGKFVPENIDTKLCTHVVYSFASLEPETLTIREFDPWADIENNLFKRATSLDVPVLLAIGGWTDSTGNKYSRLISDESNRKNFARNTALFLERHGFSGLHFDWNYPKCWQSDCRKGPASDKPNFTKLMRDLRQEFKKSNLLLGVAISGYKEVITEAYEMSRLSEAVDFLTVMTYDYHGGWESETGHVSPLYGRTGDKYPQYNTDYTMQLLVKEGADREKLIMGVPFYGQSFMLKDSHTNLVGEGTPSRGPGNAGEITRQPGMLAYYEICQLIRKQKWLSGRDGSGKSGPYATSRNQWVGYEDPESIAVKAKYVMNSGYGGVAAWTLDLDDFSNKCCNEAFPLLKSVNRVFGRINSAKPFGEDCMPPPQPVTPVPVEMTTFVEGGSVHEEHTTWPSWNPGSSTTSRATTLSTTQTTTQSTTQSTLAWWQSSSEQQSTWWSTNAPSQPSTWWSSTNSPSTWWPTASTTEASTTTEKVPNIPAPVNVMPIFIDGEHCDIGEYRSHPSNCNAYYRCVYGQLRELNCAGGLHWNQRDMLCDWPASAMCMSMPMSDDLMDEGADSSSSSTSTTSTTTRPTRRTTTSRSTRPATTRTTRATTSRTTRATTSRTTRATTPRTSRSTTSRTTRATTSKTTRSTTSRTTRATTPRTTRSTTQRTTRSTTPRTTRTTTTKATTPARTTVATMSDSEPCMSGQYYPHSDCGSFYICVNGMLIPQECGPDLQWNQNELSCDRKANVRCVSTERYLRLVKKTKALLDDPCEGDTHVPYPGNCNQFLLCLHGHLYGGDCGPGLHWSNEYKICDWPSNAHCTEEEDGSDYLSEEVNSDGDEDSINEIVPTKRPTTTTTVRTTLKPKPVTPRPAIEPHSGHFKLVCYFTNWAWYRKGVGKYVPEDIDTDLCTHIVYGFAVLDYSELTIRTHDSWADIDNRFYERVAKLKEKGVTVSLALGGWNDSQGDKYSRLVRSPAARKKFVKQALHFVEKYGFGGLDLDWEYPVCWQTECNKGFPDEKEGFTELVKDLSVEFRPRGLVLSTAVSPSKKIVDAGYDVPTLSEYFDWIAVMTYDFHGQWDKKTGHVAPLYYHPDDDISYFNANFSLHYWMEKGAPPRKLVMGMPLYGQSFTLSDTKNHGLNARAPGPGQAGESTRAAGFLAYYEICDRVHNRGWEVVQDPEGRMGPYAYKDNQWVSYDDKNTLNRKSQLIRSLGLGGGMVWALDLDDFRNHCNEGYHPLLSEIQRVLRDPPREVEPDPSQISSGESVDTSIEKLSENPVDSSVTPQGEHNNESEEAASNEDTPEETIPDEEVTPEDEIIEENLEDLNESSHEAIVEENQPSEIDTNDIQSTHLNDNYKVVCYFTNWAWYRQNGGKYVPEDIDTDLCTHIVYGFAVLDRDNLVIKPHDSWADLDNKFYERVTKLRAKGIRVLVAIGGWNDSAGDKYSRLVRDPAARARFVKHVAAFIEKYGFDGLDLDWEYPVCWQTDCNKGYGDEKENFAAFAQELNDQFKPRGWLLSTAVSPSKRVIDAGYDIPTMSDTFDWIAVMAYDFHGQWDKKTGHVAPMYQHPDDFEPTFNANFSINYWIANGADPRKLVMGMPMYGQSFSLAESRVHDLNSPTYGGGEAGDATRARGFLAYYEICERIKYKGWQIVRDRKGRMGPYAYYRDQWVSFDDAYMIRHKSEFVKAMNLGGAMIWALDLDDFRNVCECEEYPLLRTINRVLRDYPGPHPRCKLETAESEIATESPNSGGMTLVDIPQTSTRRPASSMRPDVTRPQRPVTYEEPTKPPKPTRPTIQEDTEMEVMSCNNRQFSEHSNDCNKYYQCQFGIMMEHSCAPGLHWNVDHCDWPQNANCRLNGGSQPINRPFIQPTTRRPTAATTTESAIVEKPIDEIPVIHDDPNGFKVVCYFTNWAWYRPGDGKYTPDDIDESLCTHIVYGFAVLDRETSAIRTHDSWADIDNRFYERVVALRRKGIHVTLALGGWNDSLGDKYSVLVRSATNRARFVKQAIEFIEKYNFEGLDLDWEYPVCWQVDCSKGFPDEREGFSKLVKELSDEFQPRGWLLSAAVSPSKMVIDAGYDVPTLAHYFDWIAVMTYDFHGNWDKQTGHVAPLYYYPGDTYDYFNANFSINYWIEKGAPSRKLVMGVPLYGQSFSLADSNKRGLNEKSYGPGEAGEFTRAGGFLSYYEICQRINAGGWNVVRDPAGRIGPYASRGSQWVSYDDVGEVRRKTKFMKDMNLGGGMVWALDLDDFRGVCGCGKHPLLRTMSQDLRNLPGQRASDCT